MDEKDRQNKMARLVFNKGNLEQFKAGFVALLDLYMSALEQPFEHGNFFDHDEIMERLQTLEQKQWRPIRNMFLLDPFYGYCKGDFSEDEMISPAKLMLDLIKVMDGINDELRTKLKHYDETIKSLIKEKTAAEASLAKSECQLREEKSWNSQDKTELRTSRATIAFLEGVIKEKNEKIAELSREENVQLWEREKERLFSTSEKKINALEKDLAEQRRLNESLAKRLAAMDDNNKMLRMKSDLAKGSLPPSNPKTTEELKRGIYLLEKDVIFLEQQLYQQQRTFATVLCGLKTDLVIIGENLTDPDTGQVVDKDFARVCEITTKLYNAMLEAQLAECQKSLPPHYSYLPNDFQIKRIKRVSKNSLPPLRTAATMPAGMEPIPSTEDYFDSNKEPVVENPVLIDPISKTVNTTACMRHFPHMSHEFVKEHWIKFKEFDSDGNESLDFSEVVKALKSMGMKFTATQAEEAMREADVNNSQTLDFYEYLLVADKLFSKRGQSELFHTGVNPEHRKVMAKTCVVQ